MATERLPEEIREKIVKKRDAVAACIDKGDRCDGTEIATYEEMLWLAGQMARREFGRGCAFMAKAVSENVTTTNPKTE